MSSIIETFVALFVIMDPIGNLPLFIGLTKGMPKKEVRKNVNRAVLVAGVLLFVFLFFGLQIFDFFGINLNSFQIAGGIILLIIGILYVFGTSLKYVKSHGSDVSVPIGTPLITGPGTIMTTIILAKENGLLVTTISALLALFVVWAMLLNASKLYKTLGEHWTNVISRVMGILLAAIAVEFITQGILNFINQII